MLCPLGAIWQTASRLSCGFYLGVASIWPLYHKSLIDGVLQRWLSFWKFLPSPQRNSGALSVTIRFLVTSMTKALLTRLLSLAGQPALGRVGGSKILQFNNDGGHCVLGDLHCCRSFLVPFPRSMPRHNPVLELDCVAIRASNSNIKFADDTTVEA